jgi:DNA-binding transcriptional LysR family regulator
MRAEDSNLSLVRAPHVGAVEGIIPADAPLNPIRLAVFCTVVESRSFARAADLLAMSPANVSMHIHTLEKLWGCRLFDRSRRGAHLTEAGQTVYEYATAVLRETVAVRAQLSDLASGTAGSVKFGSPAVQAVYILPALLAEFHRRYPAARVQLCVLPPDAPGEEVLRGHLDFAITSELTPIPRALRTEPLWVDSMVLVAPRDHRLAARSIVTLEEIANEDFVAGPFKTLGERRLDAALARAGLPPRRIAIVVNQHDALKQLVLNRAGLAVLFHRVVAAEVAAGQLVALQVEGVSMREEFRLVYRASHRFSPLAQNLIDFIRAAVAKLSTAAE